MSRGTSVSMNALSCLFMATMFTGCVSIPTHEKGLLEAYKKGLERSAQFMSRYDCKDAKWLIGSEISATEMQELGFK